MSGKSSTPAQCHELWKLWYISLSNHNVSKINRKESLLKGAGN